MAKLLRILILVSMVIGLGRAIVKYYNLSSAQRKNMWREWINNFKHLTIQIEEKFDLLISQLEQTLANFFSYVKK